MKQNIDSISQLTFRAIFLMLHDTCLLCRLSHAMRTLCCRWPLGLIMVLLLAQSGFSMAAEGLANTAVWRGVLGEGTASERHFMMCLSDDGASGYHALDDQKERSLVKRGEVWVEIVGDEEVARWKFEPAGQDLLEGVRDEISGVEQHVSMAAVSLYGEPIQSCEGAFYDSGLEWLSNKMPYAYYGASPNWDVVVDVAAGAFQSCAVLRSGRIKCWGNNSEIDGFPTVENVRAVSASFDHICVLESKGHVMCWNVEPGNGKQVKPPVPSKVVGVNEAESIAVGEGFGCALLSNRTVQCWGNNRSGQLGNGGARNSSRAVFVRNLKDVVAISARGAQVCAVLSSGSVKCWGNGWSYDANGNRPIGGKTLPKAISGIDEVISVATGNDHVCALLRTGQVGCWENEGNPAFVPGLENAVALSSGVGYTCALLSSGKVICWGVNWSGQTGNGLSNRWSPPTYVVGVSGAVALSAGYAHTCAALRTGGVKCWGSIEGGLGDGATWSNRSYVWNTAVYVDGLRTKF